jgi:hypothetical protein
MNDAPPSSLMDLTMNPKVTIAEGEGVGARSLTCSTSGVEGCVGDSKWGLRRLTSKSITHTDLHKSNNKLVSAELQRFWCTNPQDSPRLKFAGSHHLPPYSIICVCSRGQHLNVIFVPKLPSGSHKIPKIGTLTTLKSHNFVCKPLIEVRSEEKL